LDELTDLDTRILIPGAGRAYEAIYLHRKGFKHVVVCDWVSEAFDVLRQEAPDFPVENLRCLDFFKLEGTFDLILEQTFFCAILPSLREDYVLKVENLIRQQGSLAGLLFSHPFEKAGPPFGGTENEYRKLFSPKFEIIRMEVAKNSILPRSNNELFFQLIKK
jgi:SAM-dependent methyltransferase